jgi:heme-degrading protein
MKAAEAAVAEAKKNNMLMAIAVVELSGALVYFLKMDGTQYASIRSAQDKATSAALFRRSTKTLLMIVDSVANPAVFARNPDWQHASDVDRAMGVETRKRILDRAATDKTLIQAMHFPFPGNDHIIKEGTGYRFVPTSWNHIL